MRVLSLKDIPPPPVAPQTCQWGDNEVTAWANHFFQNDPNVNLSGLLTHWGAMKRDAKALVDADDSLKLNPRLGWEQLLQNPNAYGSMHAVIESMLIMPFAAADCERGLSVTSQIQSDNRQSLGVDSTNDILLCKFNQPAPPNFDVRPAIAEWTADRTRRLNAAPTGEHTNKRARLGGQNANHDRMVADAAAPNPQLMQNPFFT